MASSDQGAAGEKTGSHKTSSWVVVAIIIVASVVLGFAFVLKSIPLAILGGVLLIAGAVLGLMTGIMEDVH